MRLTPHIFMHIGDSKDSIIFETTQGADKLNVSQLNDLIHKLQQISKGIEAGTSESTRIVQDKPYFMKICLLGSSVELTQEFANIFAVRAFPYSYLRISGFDAYTKRMKVDNQTVNAQIWLINPSEVFRNIRPNYIRPTHAILILFDMQDRQSFQSVDKFYREVYNNVGRPISSVHIALVGIQSDTAMITTEEAQTLADKYKMHYYETKLNDSSQIIHIMTELIRQAIKKIKENIHL